MENAKILELIRLNTESIKILSGNEDRNNQISSAIASAQNEIIKNQAELKGKVIELTEEIVKLKENAVKVDYLTDEYKKLKNHPDKMKELKKEVKSRANSFFVNRNTNELEYVEYILFYQSCVAANSGDGSIYKKLNEAFNVNASGEIYVEDFDAAMTIIKRWTFSPRFKLKLLRYREKQIELAKKNPYVRQTENFLEKQLAYNRYLELTDGGQLHAV